MIFGGSSYIWPAGVAGVVPRQVWFVLTRAPRVGSCELKTQPGNPHLVPVITTQICQDHNRWSNKPNTWEHSPGRSHLSRTPADSLRALCMGVAMGHSMSWGLKQLHTKWQWQEYRWSGSSTGLENVWAKMGMHWVSTHKADLGLWKTDTGLSQTRDGTKQLIDASKLCLRGSPEPLSKPATVAVEAVSRSHRGCGVFLSCGNHLFRSSHVSLFDR